MRNREEPETVCSRFVMLREKAKVHIEIDLKEFVYAKSVAEADGYVYQAAACSDIARWLIESNILLLH